MLEEGAARRVGQRRDPVRRPTSSSASSPQADIVITGTADCGSCTAYSVYDGIELEKAGKVAVVVTTTHFRPIAETMADHFGLPELRTLVLPHPIGGTDPDTLYQWADDAVDESWRSAPDSLRPDGHQHRARRRARDRRPRPRRPSRHAPDRRDVLPAGDPPAAARPRRRRDRPHAASSSPPGRPPARNKQEWEFVVVRDAEVKHQLARLNRQALAVGRRVEAEQARRPPPGATSPRCAGRPTTSRRCRSSS